MNKYTLLVEIGTEELPSKILKKLGCDFANKISSELKKNSIYCIDLHWFVSPCHLAVKLTVQMDNNVYHTDLYSKDLNKCNVYDHVLSVIHEIDNKKYKILDSKMDGNCNFSNVLCEVVNTALMKLKSYEMMRWGEMKIPFIRPIHTVILLLDAYLIKGCICGINIDRVLYGHKFMNHSKIIIGHADEYPDILLKKGRVIVDYNKRKEIIYSRIQEESKRIGGVVKIKDDDLLEEVTSLVEWPIVLSGKFDSSFLSLPVEVIYHIMKYNHKCFPVYNSIDDTLLPYFICVINIITNNYHQIIVDYENVIKNRLMDASFFFEKDKKYRLEYYLPKLTSVLFHRKLGTLRDKSSRIAILSSWIINKIGGDVQQAERAGYLCKCDLMSNMVFEFPIAQGVIGMYYARRDGELEHVALAQKEHYYPRFSTDVLPTTNVSCAVAIADKMDTISGIFGIQELPKGNRDPFALRRAAFGILRIVIKKKLSLNLFDLVKFSVKLYGLKLTNVTVIEDICMFMYKRICSWYCMNDIKIDVIKSVLAINYSDLLHVDARIYAVNSFLSNKKEEKLKLYLMYKRILNIFSNIEVSMHEDVQEFLLKLPEEKELAEKLCIVEKKIDFLCKKNAYYEVLALILTLFDSLYKFFDHVIVLDINLSVQKNRLVLLNKIKNLYLRVMDISLLQF